MYAIKTDDSSFHDMWAHCSKKRNKQMTNRTNHHVFHCMQPGKQSHRFSQAKAPRLIKIKALSVRALTKTVLKSVCPPHTTLSKFWFNHLFKNDIRHTAYIFHKTWHSQWIYKNIQELMLHSEKLAPSSCTCYSPKGVCLKNYAMRDTCRVVFCETAVMYVCCSCINHIKDMHISEL